MRFVWIGVFGLIGIFLRYGIDSLTMRFFQGAFPLGTFIINVVGSFFVGYIYVFGIEHGSIPTDLRVGLMVGLMGGFTTFSSYSLQAAKLFESSANFTALSYWILSPVLGILSAFAGLALARR